MAEKTKKDGKRSIGHTLYLVVEHLLPNYAVRRREMQEQIEELFSKTPEAERCPHLRRDTKSPYCAQGLRQDEHIGDQRRMVCDSSSLQLWCLDKERCGECVCYKNKNEFYEPLSFFCDVPGR